MVQAPPRARGRAARGEVALGFQQLSELLHVPGIAIAGPLPAAIQITTTFSAGVGAQSPQAEAARALLAYLASPQAADAKRRQGMAPVTLPPSPGDSARTATPGTTPHDTP